MCIHKKKIIAKRHDDNEAATDVATVRMTKINLVNSTGRLVGNRTKKK